MANSTLKINSKSRVTTHLLLAKEFYSSPSDVGNLFRSLYPAIFYPKIINKCFFNQTKLYFNEGQNCLTKSKC